MSSFASSRRSFLAASAAAAAAPALSWGEAAAPRARAHRLKLGVASYSLRKFTLEQALEMCKELEVAYINIKDFHIPMNDPPEKIQEARKKIEGAGLTIMGGGTITFQNDAAQVRRAFEYARHASFPLMVTALDAKIPKEAEPAVLDIVEKMIREFDIKVAMHNHGPEDKHFPAPQDVMKLVSGRDKRFGLCVDIGHTARAGVDPVQAVRECRDRVLDLHLKDLRQVQDTAERKARDSQTEVGKGVLDIPGLFRTLQQMGFTGHLGLEYEINADNPLVGMKESFAYMRGVLDAISVAS
jgi:sugar phosphate isomerase/epimerase